MCFNLGIIHSSKPFSKMVRSDHEYSDCDLSTEVPGLKSLYRTNCMQVKKNLKMLKL